MVASRRPGPLDQRSVRGQETATVSLGSGMSDKSPRQTMTKKPGKSIKEKRADKKAKGSTAEAFNPVSKATKH